ncbi:ferredoxin [Catenulispora subtropica]|uniref:Ferredoxin n=1 Tax=Catenulispora subtropica TaxID=450798 RepID=A0ABP5ENQ5_9ACTN
MRRNDSPAPRLRVDPIACQGHGLCIEAFPEMVGRDPWGFPVLSPNPVPPHLLRHAERAVALCPVLALRMAKD